MFRVVLNPGVCFVGSGNWGELWLARGIIASLQRHLLKVSLLVLVTIFKLICSHFQVPQVNLLCSLCFGLLGWAEVLGSQNTELEMTWKFMSETAFAALCHILLPSFFGECKTWIQAWKHCNSHICFFWLPLMAFGWFYFLSHVNILFRSSVTDSAKWDIALVSSCSSAHGLCPALVVLGGLETFLFSF